MKARVRRALSLSAAAAAAAQWVGPLGDAAATCAGSRPGPAPPPDGILRVTWAAPADVVPTSNAVTTADGSMLIVGGTRGRGAASVFAFAPPAVETAWVVAAPGAPAEVTSLLLCDGGAAGPLLVAVAYSTGWGALFALALADGAPAWPSVANVSSDARAAACAGGTLAVATLAGDVRLLAVATGAVLSRTPAVAARGADAIALTGSGDMAFTGAGAAAVGTALAGEPGPRRTWTLPVDLVQRAPAYDAPRLGVVVVNYTSVVGLTRGGGRAWEAPFPLPAGGGLAGTYVMAALHAPSATLVLGTNVGGPAPGGGAYAEWGALWALDSSTGALVAASRLPDWEVLGGTPGAGLVVDATGRAAFATTWVIPQAARRRGAAAAACVAAVAAAAPTPDIVVRLFAVDASSGTITAAGAGPVVVGGDLGQLFAVGPRDGQLTVVARSAAQRLVVLEAGAAA